MSSAREAALLTLMSCETQGAWSDLALKKRIRDGGLDSRDAALATRICFGVIQNRLLCDYYIGHFSSVLMHKMDCVVRNALRLAVYQMVFLSRIPVRAAVNESVDLTRRYSKNPHSHHLVNGILRGISRNLEQLPTVPQETLVRRLSIQYSHPEWLVQHFLDVLEPSEVEALLAVNNSEPHTVAQVNTVRVEVNQVLASLQEQGVEAEQHPWLSDCITLTGGGDIEGLKAFQTGDIYIQDAASRLAILAAGLKSGMRVLDVCAAPGGKSYAAAIAMGDRGVVISCDIHPHKQALIESGAARLGLSSIQAQVQDGKIRVNAFEQAFDAVLVDAPCSGIGIIRKKPDIRYKDPLPLNGLPAVQQAILENCAAYVKPGGVLLYYTCTLFHGENGVVVDAFCQTHPEFHPESFSLPAPVGIAEEGRMTLWPHLHGTDGFFIAKLRKETRHD